LPLEAFAKKREEVIEEVLRVPERHNDNIITAFEETLRQISMVAMILGAITKLVRRCLLQVIACGLGVMLLPAVAVAPETLS